ncbi:Protein BASIC PENTACYSTEINE4-like [Ancistrocladus abbreviatus]
MRKTLNNIAERDAAIEEGETGLKLRNEWVGLDLSLNRVHFDESVMPVPGCSCTGVFRHCYKWGDGGIGNHLVAQQPCHSTLFSQCPTNAMRGRVADEWKCITRLLSRLASEGCDFSQPEETSDPNMEPTGTSLSSS